MTRAELLFWALLVAVQLAAQLAPAATHSVDASWRAIAHWRAARAHALRHSLFDTDARSPAPLLGIALLGRRAPPAVPLADECRCAPNAVRALRAPLTRACRDYLAVQLDPESVVHDAQCDNAALLLEFEDDAAFDALEARLQHRFAFVVRLDDPL